MTYYDTRARHLSNDFVACGCGVRAAMLASTRQMILALVLCYSGMQGPERTVCVCNLWLRSFDYCGERKVRRTATFGLSRVPSPRFFVDKFTLRRAESSSHCNFLGYPECQAPVPRRLLHRIAEYSVLEQLSSIILFQGIDSSASQANENELFGTPRPPLKHNLQKRRNFRLGDVSV